MCQCCLIANRGEIAVRIIHACQEMGIKTVAVYSESDAHARHVHLADAAYPISSYLEIPVLIEAALRAGCDCVHPGYGFLSEQADFAEAVMQAGLIWIGPTPQTIRQMGVKTQARALMQRAGVPLVPGFEPDAAQEADAAAFLAAAERIGYPVMVKAAGGGGGKGIRIVHHPADLPEALAAAQREASKAFGDGRVFLEKYIEAGRHIEVQIIADQHGNTLHLFERECSVQRRHQKIIEESPAPGLDAATRQRICHSAIEAARAVNYRNAGTVEFIADAQGNFYFLEMNTRLQVEHPVTEMVLGLDLVRLQFSIAAGAALPFNQADLQQQGHAIECRIYAEDPHQGFLPAPGQILKFVPPQRPGLRVDTGLQSGDAISIHYDPMIAKLIAHGRTRTEAIHRMSQALQETVILGTATNIPFLLALLHHPDFSAGQIHTAYIDQRLNELLPPSHPEADALALALIGLALAEAQTPTPHTSSNRHDNSGIIKNADRYSPWEQRDAFRIGQRRG